MATITRTQLKKKLEQNDRFALVEVLGPDAYEDYHLPNAMNIPLDRDFEDKVKHALPDLKEPIVVYCMDENCSASPKAAKRLEAMGYENVFDYEAGKVDWREAGLHVETSSH